MLAIHPRLLAIILNGTTDILLGGEDIGWGAAIVESRRCRRHVVIYENDGDQQV